MQVQIYKHRSAQDVVDIDAHCTHTQNHSNKLFELNFSMIFHVDDVDFQTLCQGFSHAFMKFV